jgi:hypothetical protein
MSEEETLEREQARATAKSSEGFAFTLDEASCMTCKKYRHERLTLLYRFVSLCGVANHYFDCDNFPRKTGFFCDLF